MTRRVAFWAILVGAWLALVELAFLCVARGRAPTCSIRREAALARLQAEPFERFQNPARKLARSAGTIRPRRPSSCAPCTGAELPKPPGPARDRQHGNRRATWSWLATSFTDGGDVGDADTYPAALERILGVATANLGVGGYDPVQALLKLEAGIAHFPKARVAVLTIRDDDVMRMPNSYPRCCRRTGLHRLEAPLNRRRFPWARSARIHSATWRRCSAAATIGVRHGLLATRAGLGFPDALAVARC